MKQLIIIPFILLAVFFSTCRDAEIQPRDYAIALTKNVTDIDQNGVTFHAEMINMGNEKIIEYGFYVSNINAYAFNKFEKIYSTKAELMSTTYEKRVTTDLDSGTVYICRAYVLTYQRTILGNKIMFRSKGTSNVNK